MNSKKLAFACAQVARDAKASDIAIYDLRGTSSITDYAIVCTATSAHSDSTRRPGHGVYGRHTPQGSAPSG